MLTSTYTLVALSVEQNTVRGALQSQLEDLHALPGDSTTLALGRAAQLCASLRQIYDSCHWRKLDKFLVPALRRHTAAADGLLHELDQLSRNAAEAIYVAEACVAHPDRPVPRERFSSAVERCVAALRLRLEREEHELFPLARSVVGDGAWFAIANQMLAHDAHARERREGQGTPAHGKSGRRAAVGRGFLHDAQGQGHRGTPLSVAH
jgi:hemerythrin-like domain-containing protein